MTKFRIFLIFFFLFCINIQAFAQDYLYKKLNSGQTVIIKEIKDNPIVTINTWVKTGSINEDDANNGVAHFLEHLFFKGSKNVPAGEFDKILESKGAVTNAATSKDYTQFYITIPSSEFDLALKLHSDMLLYPQIPADELEKERYVVIEEILRGLDNPGNILYSNLFKLIYSTDNNHPYKRPVIGTQDIIKSIPRDKIIEFYNNWYTPDNMITVVAGDINAKDVLEKVEKAFSVPYKPKHNNERPHINPIGEKLSVSQHKDISQGYYAVAFKAPKFADIKDAYALDILAVILGASDSSILNSELKEKKQLVSSIGASYSQYIDDGLFIVHAKFEKDKSLGVIKQEIYNEISKIKNGNITKEQLQKAKNILHNSTDYARESAENIANELGFFTLFYGSPKLYDNYLKRIDSVSLDDVLHVANKYLDFSHDATSTVLPQGYQDISYNNSAMAARIFPDSAEKTEHTDFETKYLLDNGSTLIVRKNTSNSIVAINISAKGGMHLAKNSAIPYLAAANAARGTNKRTREQLSEFFDETGISLDFKSYPDYFSISLLTTKRKLNEALNILDETINQASFPQQEIDKTRKNYKNYVKSLKDRPLYLAMDYFAGEAYKGSVYANNNQTTLKYIDSVTRDEIIDFYNKILDSKNVVISVTGNVDDNYLIKRFNSIFSDKGEKSVEIKDFMKETFIPQNNIIQKFENKGKETSWLVVGYKTGNIYDIKEIAVSSVIDSLLGTGMSSRLFKSVREEKSLAYQVGSTVQRSGNDSALFAYVGCNPKNLTEASNTILNEFEKLKKEFVPQTELKEAKDKLLGHLIISLETNMDRSFLLTKYTAYGYNLKYLDDLKKAVSDVTSSDIMSFANKYFSKPYIEIIVGP